MDSFFSRSTQKGGNTNKMNTLQEYIESGILELYVLGMLTPEEIADVQNMSLLHAEVRKEIEAISDALVRDAESTTAPPHPAIKPFLMAVIDYTERLQAGEQPAFPPSLNEHSTAADFSEWLQRKDMELTADFEEMYAKIIGYTPQMTTAIAWIKTMAPQEVHDNEYEKFLILEGACEITVENTVHKLKAGDYFSIPLHAGHSVVVTSDIPCKVILQRMAA